MSLKVLFWNVGLYKHKVKERRESFDEKSPLIGQAIRLMNAVYHFDLIVLADFNNNSETGSNNDLRSKFLSTIDLSTAYTPFENFHERFLTIHQHGVNIQLINGDEKYSQILEVHKENKKWVLIPIHLKSRAFVPTERDQNNRNRSNAKTINHFSNFVQDIPVIVFGDFNYDPFSEFLSDRQDGFSTSPLRQDFFDRNRKMSWYNPSWALLGDFIRHNNSVRTPPGSYFLKDNHSDYHRFWHLTEQVLLNQPASENAVFNYQEFRLITDCQNHEFWEDKKGQINPHYSDHLPMTFTLN